METTISKFGRSSLVAAAVSVAGVLSLASARAAEPAEGAVDARPKAASTRATIAACLEKVDLSQQQQTQIQEIVRGYDADLTAVWKEFGERYLETVRTEALLLSAIEDNLTEAQRKQVRDQRRKTAQHQKSLAGTNAKSNQATTQPASAVEEELAIVGVALTVEQESAADEIQEKYLSRLRSLNRDIQGLHMRLVSLEADKLVEIENVLTKEQLVQLREIRQNAPASLKVTAGTGPAATR